MKCFHRRGSDAVGIRKSLGNHRPAFTLIELLVVLAIIAILISLLLPAVSHIITEAARTKAATQTVMVANAISNYRRIYGRWPGQLSTSTEERTVDGKIHSVMMVADLTNNPRGMVLLELPENSFNSEGGIVDPWQRRLEMVVDQDGDGSCLNATKGCSEMPGVSWTISVTGRTVAVWSWGPNPHNEDKRVPSWTR